MGRHARRILPIEDEYLSNGTIIYWTKRQRHINQLNQSYFMVPVKCPNCGHVRDVQTAAMTRMQRLSKWTGLCNHCVSKVTLPQPAIGEDSPHWKGGRYLHTSGYWMQVVARDHPFACMAPPSQQKKKYGLPVLLLHRLVMAEHLRRPLFPWEIVHHKDEDKNNNTIDNLELIPHASIHNQITFLAQRIHELERENQRLQALLNQQGQSR